MEVKLPQTGPLTLEVKAGTAFARYSMSYDNGVTPEPSPEATELPVATAAPVEEKHGPGILPIVLIILAVIGAAGAYGFYIWRKKSEDDDDVDDDEDDSRGEKALREQHLQRTRAQSAAVPGASLRHPNIRSTELPAYMRNGGKAPEDKPKEEVQGTEPQTASGSADVQNSPYARKDSAPVTMQEPIKPTAPVPPTPPVAPKPPVAPEVKPVSPASVATPVYTGMPVQTAAPSFSTQPVAAAANPVFTTGTPAQMSTQTPAAPVLGGQPVAAAANPVFKTGAPAQMGTQTPAAPVLGGQPVAADITPVFATGAQAPVQQMPVTPVAVNPNAGASQPQTDAGNVNAAPAGSEPDPAGDNAPRRRRRNS